MSEMAIDYKRRPITVEEYQRMAEVGIIGPQERVELIDGEIVLMAPLGPLHISSLARITELFVLRLAPRAVVIPQAPMAVSGTSEPEPDFQILLRRDDFYLGERPSPTNCYALVECADTSLRYDRGKKLSVYARGGVREYWVVNLVDHCVEIYREPHEIGYAVTTVHRSGDVVAFAALPEVRFTVDELLGPAPQA